MNKGKTNIIKNIKIIGIIEPIIFTFLFLVVLLCLDYPNKYSMIEKLLLSSLISRIISYSIVAFIYCLISNTYIRDMIVGYINWTNDILKSIPSMIGVPAYSGCLTVFLLRFVLILLIPLYIVGFVIEVLILDVILSFILSIFSFPYLFIKEFKNYNKELERIKSLEKLIRMIEQCIN